MAAEEARPCQQESLDFLSDKFDPLRALYTEELQPPFPNIQVFNNLAEYARVIKEGKAKTSIPKRVSRGPNKRTRNLKPEFKPVDINTRLTAIAQQQQAANQGLVSRSGEKSPFLTEGLAEKTLGLQQAEKRWKKKYKNVLDRMEESISGPFNILYKCLKERYKVQVWIRKYKGLRSVLTGYVIAFDKHLNLALMDVDELYTVEERVCPLPSGETKTKKKKKKKKRKNHLQRTEPPSDSCVDKENQTSTIKSGNHLNTCIDSASFLKEISSTSSVSDACKSSKEGKSAIPTATSSTEQEEVFGVNSSKMCQSLAVSQESKIKNENIHIPNIPSKQNNAAFAGPVTKPSHSKKHKSSNDDLSNMVLLEKSTSGDGGFTITSPQVTRQSATCQNNKERFHKPNDRTAELEAKHEQCLPFPSSESGQEDILDATDPSYVFSQNVMPHFDATKPPVSDEAIPTSLHHTNKTHSLSQEDITTKLDQSKSTSCFHFEDITSNLEHNQLPISVYPTQILALNAADTTDLTSHDDTRNLEQRSSHLHVPNPESVRNPNLDSSNSSYLFSRDLTVRVPAYDDEVSRDLEFTLVGIFQPKTNQCMNVQEQESTIETSDPLGYEIPLSLQDQVGFVSSTSEQGKQELQSNDRVPAESLQETSFKEQQEVSTETICGTVLNQIENSLKLQQKQQDVESIEVTAKSLQDSSLKQHKEHTEVATEVNCESVENQKKRSFSLQQMNSEAACENVERQHQEVDTKERSSEATKTLRDSSLNQHQCLSSFVSTTLAESRTLTLNESESLSMNSQETNDSDGNFKGFEMRSSEHQTWLPPLSFRNGTEQETQSLDYVEKLDCVTDVFKKKEDGVTNESAVMDVNDTCVTDDTVTKVDCVTGVKDLMIAQSKMMKHANVAEDGVTQVEFVTEVDGVTDVDTVIKVDDVTKDDVIDFGVTDVVDVTTKDCVTDKDNVTKGDNMTDIDNAMIKDCLTDEDDVTKVDDVTNSDNAIIKDCVTFEDDVTKVDDVTNSGNAIIKDCVTFEDDVTKGDDVTDSGNIVMKDSVTDIKNEIIQQRHTEQVVKAENNGSVTVETIENSKLIQPHKQDIVAEGVSKTEEMKLAYEDEEAQSNVSHSSAKTMEIVKKKEQDHLDKVEEKRKKLHFDEKCSDIFRTDVTNETKETRDKNESNDDEKEDGEITSSDEEEEKMLSPNLEGSKPPSSSETNKTMKYSVWDRLGYGKIPLSMDTDQKSTKMFKESTKDSSLNLEEKSGRHYSNREEKSHKTQRKSSDKKPRDESSKRTSENEQKERGRNYGSTEKKTTASRNYEEKCTKRKDLCGKGHAMDTTKDQKQRVKATTRKDNKKCAKSTDKLQPQNADKAIRKTKINNQEKEQRKESDARSPSSRKEQTTSGIPQKEDKTKKDKDNRKRSSNATRSPISINSDKEKESSEYLWSLSKQIASEEKAITVSKGKQDKGNEKRLISTKGHSKSIDVEKEKIGDGAHTLSSSNYESTVLRARKDIDQQRKRSGNTKRPSDTEKEKKKVGESTFSRKASDSMKNICSKTGKDKTKTSDSPKNPSSNQVEKEKPKDDCNTLAERARKDCHDRKYKDTKNIVHGGTEGPSSNNRKSKDKNAKNLTLSSTKPFQSQTQHHESAEMPKREPHSSKVNNGEPKETNGSKVSKTQKSQKQELESKAKGYGETLRRKSKTTLHKHTRRQSDDSRGPAKSNSTESLSCREDDSKKRSNSKMSNQAKERKINEVEKREKILKERKSCSEPCKQVEQKKQTGSVHNPNLKKDLRLNLDKSCKVQSNNTQSLASEQMVTTTDKKPGLPPTLTATTKVGLLPTPVITNKYSTANQSPREFQTEKQPGKYFLTQRTYKTSIRRRTDLTEERKQDLKSCKSSKLSNIQQVEQRKRKHKKDKSDDRVLKRLKINEQSVDLKFSGSAKTRTLSNIPSGSQDEKLKMQESKTSDCKIKDCMTKRIDLGKGKFLSFHRRHANQLFIRGDNVVMVSYAV